MIMIVLIIRINDALTHPPGSGLMRHASCVARPEAGANKFQLPDKKWGAGGNLCNTLLQCKLLTLPVT